MSKLSPISHSTLKEMERERGLRIFKLLRGELDHWTGARNLSSSNLNVNDDLRVYKGLGNPIQEIL